MIVSKPYYNKEGATIPVTMHNVPAEKVYRPHAWNSFGTQDQQAADYAACKQYGPLYR